MVGKREVGPDTVLSVNPYREKKVEKEEMEEEESYCLVKCACTGTLVTSSPNQLNDLKQVARHCHRSPSSNERFGKG